MYFLKFFLGLFLKQKYSLWMFYFMQLLRFIELMQHYKQKQLLLLFRTYSASLQQHWAFLHFVKLRPPTLLGFYMFKSFLLICFQLPLLLISLNILLWNWLHWKITQIRSRFRVLLKVYHKLWFSKNTVQSFIKKWKKGLHHWQSLLQRWRIMWAVHFIYCPFCLWSFN